MQRLIRHFIFLCGALALASSSLAQSTNTIASKPLTNVPAPEQTMPPGPQADGAAVPSTNNAASVTEIEEKIQQAREQRHQKDLTQAAQTLENVLKVDAPAELHRQALFERALVAQDNSEPVKAQQIWAQYLHLYSTDPSVPDVLLRQGLLYRDMGVHTLAISKFYAVMSSALKPQMENLDYYKKLVVQAQTEIAETYDLDARYADAAEFYNRILLAGEAEADREPLECKLIRSMSHLTNADDYIRSIGKEQTFLAQFPNCADVPEVRFLLASALKNVGRNQDSMRQVLLLLQAEQENVNKNPDVWFYWQRRAGNEIANQLYKEADYLDALQIYLSLADLDKSPAWQLPVWYQTGLDYEQLLQWQLANDIYTQIVDRQKDLNETNSTPMLTGIIDMAKWRRDYIAWQQKARESNLALHFAGATNAPPTTMHPE